jgi:hypothetical protein
MLPDGVRAGGLRTVAETGPPEVAMARNDRATMEDGGAVEVATVGNEGIVGVFLGGHGMRFQRLLP